MGGSEPGWEEQDLDRVRTRRKALLSLLETDISLLMNGAGTGPADLKLEQALRLEIASLSKVRLWHFVWSLPEGKRLAGRTAGGEPQLVDAFVLAGPASLARIAGAFRKPNFSASDLYAARQTLGGDDVQRYIRSLGPEAGEVTSRLIECLKTADRREGAVCLGMDLAWPNSIGTDQEQKLAFTAKIADGNADWSPARLRQNKTLAPKKDFVEALIAASVATRKDVLAAARRDRERREKEEPLRMLFDGNSVSSEVLSFNSRAEADLVGFSGPVEGEPVVLKVAELPFYKRTRLIDMLDRRSGYPKIARFMGEYSMESNVISYERVLPIDWQSRTIIAKNASETLHLKAETVPSYLKFFCQYIRGSDGYFRIIEDPEELAWLGISRDFCRQAANHVHPIELWTPEAVPGPTGDADKQGQGYYLARGWVIYSRALFAAVFLVSESGAVDMIEDQPFGVRLPIVPETISKKTHFIYLLREGVQA